MQCAGVAPFARYGAIPLKAKKAPTSRADRPRCGELTKECADRSRVRTWSMSNQARYAELPKLRISAGTRPGGWGLLFFLLQRLFRSNLVSAVLRLQSERIDPGYIPGEYRAAGGASNDRNRVFRQVHGLRASRSCVVAGVHGAISAQRPRSSREARSPCRFSRNDTAIRLYGLCSIAPGAVEKPPTPVTGHALAKHTNGRPGATLHGKE